ncbi:MAG TPA: peptidase T [Treponemataceae bacterium]|nr:peptidase T [Treponemataceae bacterium]
MSVYQKTIRNTLKNRFLSYVKIWTTSNPENAEKGIIPSTKTQLEFAKKLKAELLHIGVTDVFVTEHAYVCARINAIDGYEKAPSIGFLAHMDTAMDVSGKDVKPQIVKNYKGQLIQLKEGVVLDPKTDKHLANAQGQTLITTDGTTLLGADDKAGIAEIMTAAEYIIQNNIPHGQIELIFTPDEETGHGMDKIPIEWIQSKQCYTLDGGHVGEVEVECFSAWKSVITFTGIAMHTGSARPKLVNSVTMCSEFLNLLPKNEAPETTDGYQGFYAPLNVSGHIEQSTCTVLLRDFKNTGIEKRKKNIDSLASAIECKYRGSTVTVVHRQQYLNMKEKIDKNPAVKKTLTQAVENLGIKPIFKPIRGGTDGSRLTEMGIPTPNIFTGGHNFHSRQEWASLEQMCVASEMVLELVKIWSNL